jgi:hypothetical protein
LTVIDIPYLSPLESKLTPRVLSSAIRFHRLGVMHPDWSWLKDIMQSAICI